MNKWQATMLSSTSIGESLLLMVQHKSKRNEVGSRTDTEERPGCKLGRDWVKIKIKIRKGGGWTSKPIFMRKTTTPLNFSWPSLVLLHHSLSDSATNSLVLYTVHNSPIDKTLDKVKPCYFGPMIVIRRSKAGSYILGEGSLSKLRYAVFRLIPYHSRFKLDIPLHDISNLTIDTLDDITHDSPHPEQDIPYSVDSDNI